MEGKFGNPADETESNAVNKSSKNICKGREVCLRRYIISFKRMFSEIPSLLMPFTMRI